MKPATGSTVIGKSVIIRGELTASEDLFIDGEIEGTIALSDCRLTVGPGARVVADVRVRDIVVFGSIQGNIQASGRVELRQSAVVDGDISAARLSIEESAIIKGRIELTDETAAKPPLVASPPRPVPHPVPSPS